VFTRERDLSFLPVGVGEIGAAIIGPTRKGPAFVPTVVTSFADFEEIFGTYTTDYYTPYAVREYLRSAGSVTIVKVGYLGGYIASSVNLVVAGAGGNPNLVAATFAPTALNGSGVGSVSASLAGDVDAASFTLSLAGANATASVSGLAIGAGAGTGTLFSDVIGTDPNQSVIGSTAAPQYIYKDFKSSISASLATDAITAASAVSIEVQSNGLDFQSGGGDSVNATTYEITNSGNKDSAAARTPYIQSQKVGGSATNLFRIYMRVDGTQSNGYYVVVSDVKPPSTGNSSPDFAEFSLALHSSNGALVEGPINKLNLDPASANYLPKVIGDQFQTVTTAGEVVLHGDFPNLSKHMRVGDYDEKVFKGTKSLQPMGFAKVFDPVVATATVPTASFNTSQVTTQSPLVYNPNVPYGIKLSETYFNENELDTNLQYLSPIPAAADNGGNADFSLENMKGFGLTTSEPITTYGTSFVTEEHNLTVSASSVQLKFAVPMQHGFDGGLPARSINTGGDITASNVMGFDCSSATASGSIAYKRAIDVVSNPDEIDINMLVTPGIIHSLHPSVTNHAMDKVESRADCFYILDTAQWNDNVSTAVNNVATIDTNYAATYYPWVKIDDPSTGIGVWVPPSVVIPGVIAFTDRVAHEWFAPAGLNRGGLSSVRVAKRKLTHTDRDRLYEARVNPIATFPNQGVVVFGQKTLQAKPSALDRINVRRLLIRLKKFIASSSRFLVFEQNDSSTRSRFLNIVNPFLESVQSNSGLSAFRVVMDDSNNTPDVIDRNQLVGQIFIQPTRTAEFIVLDFTVLPTGAAFPE
jgi:hypothetical protein